MSDAAAATDAVERAVREDSSRILATLIRVTGDVDIAQDALQEAVVRALRTWPGDGIPREPRAWLITVARRCAIDRIRREAVRDTKEAQAMAFAFDEPLPPPDSVVRDDLLRLMFTCCHPSLSLDAQVALCLRTLGGLSTVEIARALVVPEQTMAKRLTRAKQKIRIARIPYRVPSDDELPTRLPGVLTTIFLIFNEGYAAGGGQDLMRVVLTDEALRLGRLAHALMPDEASVSGLLALMLLQDSRRAARSDGAGNVIPLAEQDRGLWNAAQIREGVELVGAALRRTPRQPDQYAVQAAIAACHALAPDYASTDWDAIVSWYDVLLSVQDVPAARLGRASAIAERDGAAVGLAEVDAITGLDQHAWWHASRAELLYRLGRDGEGADACAAAIALGLNSAHARYLQRPRLEH